MYVCDVGQGDAIYFRFPDGRDVLIDGGPNDAVISCLSRHMPFWDRGIDMVMLTHPEKDHLQGLLSVLARFDVGYIVRSDVSHTSEGFMAFQTIVRENKIPERVVQAGEEIDVGDIHMVVMWPTSDQIASMKPKEALENVLGATSEHRNDGSLVLWLQYGEFDAWLSGDADSHVESGYRGKGLAGRSIDVLKVPHHGSKTGMTEAFVQWLRPMVSIISVGKNTYGHPSQEAMNLLTAVGSKIVRTDSAGDIEIVSDGSTWYFHGASK